MIKGTAKDAPSISWTDPEEHRFTCNCHKDKTEIMFRVYEKENNDVVFSDDPLDLIYKY